MPLQPMDKFTFNHSDQQDALYSVYTATQIKALFDSRWEELRTALNLLINALSSTEGASDIGTNTIQDLDGTTIQAMLQSIRDKLKSKTDGSSGADYVNATAIQGLNGETVQSILKSLKTYVDNTKEGLNTSINNVKNDLNTSISGLKASNISADPIAVGSGNTVQAQLAWLLSQIAVAATGSIPDGSITEAKLAQALVDKINKSLSNIGVMSTLLTTDKSSLVNALNEHMAEDAIHTVSGTANTITVSIGNYVYSQFKQLRILAAFDNTDKVTINVDSLGAVPALKFDGSQLPAGTIKAGKIYDWYYDESNGGRFFLIAKASGNAGAGDVLAGKTASGDNGEFTGAMPNNGAVTITPGTTDKTIAVGYHNGSGKVVGDINLIAGNIKKDIKLFGITGTLEPILPGDTVVIASNTARTNLTTTPTKLKEIQVSKKGTYRVKFDLYPSSPFYAAYGQIYVNGVPRGILRNNTQSSTPITFTEDITINDNDLIQIYAYSAGAGYDASVRNFTIGLNLGTFTVKLD